MKQRICIITGTRAEYDLLKPLMILFNQDKSCELQIIVTGMHLSPEFGLTVRTIEQDQLPIAHKIEMLLSSDTDVAVAKSTGLGIISFADSLQQLNPDIIIVLGDRFEILSAVIPAFMMKIPILHIHGGETTKGAFDEGFRHAITKMSFLHCTATEDYRKRVIQLGENPERVFNVGSIGVESIKALKLLSKKELEYQLGFRFKQKNLLVTFHPATLEYQSAEDQVSNLLAVLKRYSDFRVIFTKSNADTQGRAVNEMIDVYVAEHPEQAVSFMTMGQLKFFSTMQFVDAVVGNSSSGIIEAPSFHIGTINIGDRQTGRKKAASVIDCNPNVLSIEQAFKKLFSHQFQRSLKEIVNPYDGGATSKKIFDIIKTYPLEKGSLKKEFYDIQF